MPVHKVSPPVDNLSDQSSHNLPMLTELHLLLSESQPLLLFLVIGIGYLLGHIRVKGFSLGVAGVLFAGLAFGAWQPEGSEPLLIAPQVMEIGLILFVYAIGLASGPGFFASMRHGGSRLNSAVLLSLVTGGVVVFLIGRAMALTSGQIAGVYCGSLTNTPALAAATQLLRSGSATGATDATIGYSISYPFGVLGALMIFGFFVARNRAEADTENTAAQATTSGARELASSNFEVTNRDIAGHAIGELQVRTRQGLQISRIRRDGTDTVPSKYTILQLGDLVHAVGTKENLAKGIAYFGAPTNVPIEAPGGAVELRRVIVSNKEVAGRTLEELEFEPRFNAQITRLRRADFEVAPQEDMRLELGDRLLVVAPKEKLAAAAQFFGDSAREAATLDFAALTFGISLGVLVGLIPIPIPGLGAVNLGIAGGPLVVALLLGHMGRTGPFVWIIPFEASETLRHVGLLFFLAGVGVRAGGQLLGALAGPGLQLLILGLICTTVTFATLFLLLRKWAKSGIAVSLGAASGMHTQPASLARARELTTTDDVLVAYATTYPFAMIGKIIIAQVLVMIGGA